ncbi:maleylacetate reductase [Nonomuraea sp. NEAU-A123]|uniref:maleylacetate reductase n=1 Tax=Nonomuraea sp. NEAU-A123 TaxID=2839649 RepID=UPI001BE450E7|nr:maleylacetate reductase [Nonomuraea sp. NEAU-A123]
MTAGPVTESPAPTFVHEQGASRVVFGPGEVRRVGAEAVRLGAERILLISDRRNRGVADTIAGLLGGRVCGRVVETATHVPHQQAEDATRLARTRGADLLVCVGGGSATGLAKAVALRTRTRILAVPTTYAGSEMTPIWGITRDGHKRTGRDPVVQPVTVVYDPELTYELSPAFSSGSGMNAVAHLVEAGYAPRVSPVTAAISVQGLCLLAGALPRVTTTPRDPVARADALKGAWLAGWALGSAPMGLHHKICHVLGGAYGLPHAAVHSAVLPYVAAYNRSAAPQPLRRVAEALGGDDAAGALWDLRHAIGAPAALEGLGFTASDLDHAAALVVEEHPVNPRPADVAGVRAILLAALDGRHPTEIP